MEPAITLVPAATPVEPGSTGTAQITVRNTGQVVEQFGLEILGPTASWTVVEPSELRLFPGDEGAATVRFSPPRDASVLAGEATFGVRVTPIADPASAVVEEATITVAGFSAVSADLSPRNVDGKSATHKVSVHNRGNAATSVSLSYVDADERTAGTVQPPELSVGGGEEATATLKVVPRGRRHKNANRLAYQVVVTPAGQPPLTLDASLTRAGKRRKTPLIAAVIILLVGLIAFVALRPKVESAAIEIKQVKAQLVAAKTAVEQAQEQVATAKQAATTGAAAAGEAATETTTTVTTTLEATTTSVSGTDPTTPVTAAGGGPVEATTTTQSPEVAAALTGQDAFGTVATPKVTCVGGKSSSGAGSTSTSTSTSTTGRSGSASSTTSTSA